MSMNDIFFEVGKDEKKAPPKPGYVCRICDKPGHYIHDCPERESSKRKVERSNYNNKSARRSYQHAPRDKQIFTRESDSKACWFCTSSANFEKHLVIEIRDEFYVAIPKGGFSAQHLLIVPINHTQTLESRESLDELRKLKSDVAHFFLKDGFGLTMSYERHTGNNNNTHMAEGPPFEHMNVQLFGFDTKLLERILNSFTSLANRRKICVLRGKKTSTNNAQCELNDTVEGDKNTVGGVADKGAMNKEAVGKDTVNKEVVNKDTVNKEAFDKDVAGNVKNGCAVLEIYIKNQPGGEYEKGTEHNDHLQAVETIKFVPEKEDGYIPPTFAFKALSEVFPGRSKRSWRECVLPRNEEEELREKYAIHFRECGENDKKEQIDP